MAKQELDVQNSATDEPIQTADGWVAATALLHDIPVVTHNRNHFVGVDGLAVISEDNP